MRITAISDIHGSLIPIPRTDLLIIAGDWSPLEIQQNDWAMRQWLATQFIPWMKKIECSRICFIAGNHDFICEPVFLNSDLLLTGSPRLEFSRDILHPLLQKHNLLQKVCYLENSFATYNGLRIFGCPYVEGCRGWAFSQSELKFPYSNIKKCDILITHQPPQYNLLGTTCIDNKEYSLGSVSLLERIKQIKPKLVFSGHIHEGNHQPQILQHSNTKKTILYNCAIKDEEYEVRFNPQTLEI